MTDCNRPESENNDSEINARAEAQSRETTSDYSDTDAASAEQPHKSITLNRGLIAAGFVALAVVGSSLGYENWQLQNRVNTLETSLLQMQENAVSLATNSNASPQGRAQFNTGQIPGYVDPWAQSPQELLQEMQQRMQQLNLAMSGRFGSLQDPTASNGKAMNIQQPEIQVKNEKKAYEVVIDVPAGADVDVSTRFDGHQFTLNGTVKNELKNQQQEVTAISRFSRSMYLPDNVDEAAMTTKNKGDQIVITLPKIS